MQHNAKGRLRIIETPEGHLMHLIVDGPLFSCDLKYTLDEQILGDFEDMIIQTAEQMINLMYKAIKEKRRITLAVTNP